MAPLYRTWFEFTGWLLTAAGLLFLLQGQLNWWQPAVLWVLFSVLFFLTRRLGYDPGAIPLLSIPVFCGWLFLTRLDPNYATGHFGGVMLGGLAFLLGVVLKPTKHVKPLFWGFAALVLLLITVLVGESVGGAKAWLTVLGLRFQPVELARIFVVLYLAQSLHGEQSEFELTCVLGCFFLLLAWQRDLGPALLVFFVFCWLSLANHFSWYKLLAYFGTAIAGFVLAVQLFPHFRARAVAWLWPWNYLDSIGYQVLQGLFALRAGGLVGQGLGGGHTHVIPQGHTDYLFAIIGEELGFFGTFSLILVYFALAFWAFRILGRIEDKKQQMIGLGLTLLLHGQVLLVIGGILRLVPFTGMTLPFMSYGSTSLVAQFWMIGILSGLTGNGGAS
ncbi:MAG: FtsW/RodA/SpoVE family cell cycle protein [Firmicutes bacterium]|nr:FtsW/RodA/SpoVE family cell cycle protein [Bacillota bacterium]